MAKKNKDDSDLIVKLCKTNKDLMQVYNYEVDVFAEAGDFEWSMKALNSQKDSGWNIYGVFSPTDGDEIISALFTKVDGGEFHTKNTSLKISHQGIGISHKIKDFFEKEARSKKSKNIVHFCAVDNFRNIALNESHGYQRIESINNGETIKWSKLL